MLISQNICKAVLVVTLLVAQVCTTEAFMAKGLPVLTRCKLYMGARAATYTAIRCPWKPESELLVRDTEPECLQQSTLFSAKEFEVASGKSLVSDWIKKGVAFWADDDGLASLHASEHQKPEKDFGYEMSWGAAGQYINFGTER